MTKVQSTSTPHGNVNVIDEETAAKLKGEFDDTVDKAEKKLDKAEKDYKEKFGEFETAVKKYFNKFSSAVAGYTQSFAVRSKKEVQNPVVISQIVLGVGALGGAYIGYLERSRIFGAQHFKSAVTAHAAIITGLVVLDGFLFNKYYSKYDKK